MFSIKTYVVGYSEESPQLEAILMSTHYICFCETYVVGTH